MSELDSYERDHARILSSGPHTFTDEMRRKNLGFRAKVKHLLPIPDRFKLNDCDLLYRFLIARNWDFEVAAKNLAEYVEWRAKERLDTIVTEAIDPQVEAALPTFFGLDVEGFPILFDTPDPKVVTLMLKTVPRETMMRGHLKLMEQARYLSKVNGVDRISYVMDLTNISISTVTSAAVSFLKEVSHMDQHFYPEVMRRMLICNGGWMITGVWNVIRPLLDVRIQKKIRFFKDLPSVITVAEFISPENMHPRYGGVCETSVLESQLQELHEGAKRSSQMETEMTVSPFHHEAELEEIPSIDMEVYSVPSSSDSEEGDADKDNDGVPLGPRGANKQRQLSLPAPPKMIVCASSIAAKHLHGEGSSFSRVGMGSSSHDERSVSSQEPDSVAAPASPPERGPLKPRAASPCAMMTQLRIVRTSSRSLRGLVGDVLIGEKIDDQLFAPVTTNNVPDLGGSVTAGKSPGLAPMQFSGSPSRFAPVTPQILIGELLPEAGHLIHTHIIVADSNRNAQFILMKRKLHSQIIIFQVVGDAKIFTDHKLHHSVTGEKVKMATCGEREMSLDNRDWVIWGKVKIGSATTRKYLAEKKGSDVTFFAPLNTVPNEVLLSLVAGLMQLWES
jgi:hypothetical protein